MIWLVVIMTGFLSGWLVSARIARWVNGSKTLYPSCLLCGASDHLIVGCPVRKFHMNRYKRIPELEQYGPASYLQMG